jgi:hypothetical protein
MFKVNFILSSTICFNNKKPCTLPHGISACAFWFTIKLYCFLTEYYLIGLHGGREIYSLCRTNYFYVKLIQVIKTSLCPWLLQYRKLQVMFKVSPASVQTFINTPNWVLEDRVQYSTVPIPNVFCDGHLQIINCVRVFCTVIIRCTDTFWSPCINPVLRTVHQASGVKSVIIGIPVSILGTYEAMGCV